MNKVKPDTSAVFVPAAHAAKAIEEAINAEIPLVVSVAEHIPVHDMLRVQEVLRTQSKTRLVGPNCPGIIAPGKCRIGIMPFTQYSPGVLVSCPRVGRSAMRPLVPRRRQVSDRVLSAAWVAICFPVGAKPGHPIIFFLSLGSLDFETDTKNNLGTTLVGGLRMFFDHDDTKGIVVIGEIGGRAELDAAELIEKYRAQNKNPKPIIALVAGQTAPPGKTMGHAGALLSPGEQGAMAKARALQEAGAVVVPHPGLIGIKMKKLLNRQP